MAQKCLNHDSLFAKHYCQQCGQYFCDMCVDARKFHIINLKFCRSCSKLLLPSIKTLRFPLLHSHEFPGIAARMIESLKYPFSTPLLFLMVFVGLASSLAYPLVGDTVRVLLVIFVSSFIIFLTGHGRKTMEWNDLNSFSDMFRAGIMGIIAYTVSFLPYVLMLQIIFPGRGIPYTWENFWALSDYTPGLVFTCYFLLVIVVTVFTAQTKNVHYYFSYAADFILEHTKTTFLTFFSILIVSVISYLFYFLRPFIYSVPIAGFVFYQIVSLFFPFVIARLIGWQVYDYVLSTARTTTAPPAEEVSISNDSYVISGEKDYVVDIKEDEPEEVESHHEPDLVFPVPIRYTIDKYQQKETDSDFKGLIAIYNSYKKFLAIALLSLTREYKIAVSGPEAIVTKFKSDQHFFLMSLSKLLNYFRKENFSQHHTMKYFLEYFYSTTPDLPECLQFSMQVSRQLDMTAYCQDEISPYSMLFYTDKYLRSLLKDKSESPQLSQFRSQLKNAIFELLNTCYLMKHSTLAYVIDDQYDQSSGTHLLEIRACVNGFEQKVSHYLIQNGTIEILAHKIYLLFTHEEDPPLMLFPEYDFITENFVELELSREVLKYKYRNPKDDSYVLLSDRYLQYQSAIDCIFGRKSAREWNIVLPEKTKFTSAPKK
ncbi:hypothetical protein ACFL27_16560 [candidate division CSSED10-310 bacterium]|uniref:B box-type domain-containing protein n=1 Tax=candidate division CSSED10-310 bacterium TaxID=2855610 RepID=A0ABV6Z037_UNCC1